MHSFPLPVPTLEFAVSLLWHPRLDSDPTHRWLHAHVRDVQAGAASVSGGPPALGSIEPSLPWTSITGFKLSLFTTRNASPPPASVGRFASEWSRIANENKSGTKPSFKFVSVTNPALAPLYIVPPACYRVIDCQSCHRPTSLVAG